MSTETTPSGWTDPSFLDQVRTWVAEAAHSHGLALRGHGGEPHLRPWSTAVRLQTDGGALWFKANARGTRYEAALVGELGRLVPDLVPDVLATDPGRGWSLTRDAGPALRSVAAPEDLWDHWQQLLPRYAAAQLLLADRVAELSATGVPVLAPAELPARLEELMADLGRTPVDDGGLSAEDGERLRAALPAYAGWCFELAASPVPVSLQHDDLHSANVCWPGGPEAARVLDWGDASVSFPLATMLSTLNSIAHHSGRELTDPRVERVRDAYLEPFATFAPHADLVRYVDLARRTGCVSRALAWASALRDEPAATHRTYGFPVRGWLLQVLEA